MAEARPLRSEGASLVIRVSGLDYPIPPALVRRLHGPAPPPGFACDGCSASPDRWPPWWLPLGGPPANLIPACGWHDGHYARGGDRRDRRRADAWFYYNLQVCGLGAWWAGVYYRRVRLWGLPHFAWAEGEEPNVVSAGLASLASRYRIPSPAEIVPSTERRLAADAA